MKEQQSSKSQKSSHSNEQFSLSPKNVDDDLWDMPTPTTKTEIAKSDQKATATTSFFEFGTPDTVCKFEVNPCSHHSISQTSH
jgi:hypothetical protein